jgi:hypothetical protein
MPKGGKLTLETKNEMLDETYSRAYTEVTPGEYVMVAVSYRGAAFPRASATRSSIRSFPPRALAKAPASG